MLSLKFALSHFIHKLKAKNRHGLHSPFVYRLVDEVIYNFSHKKVYTDIEKLLPAGKKLNSTDKLLYRLAADAGAQSVWLLGKHQPQHQIILSQATGCLTTKKLDDAGVWKQGDAPGVIFIDAQLNPQSAIDYFNHVLPLMNANTLLIIYNMHQNVLTKTTWAVMRSHGKVTATVNLFWMGLIYCRPGQVKEDFLIKF